MTCWSKLSPTPPLSYDHLVVWMMHGLQVMLSLLEVARLVVHDNAEDDGASADRTEERDGVAEDEDSQPDGDRPLHRIADAGQKQTKEFMTTKCIPEHLVYLHIDLHIGRGSSVVNSVPCVRRVACSNPSIAA